jgi:hypothetical protein
MGVLSSNSLMLKSRLDLGRDKISTQQPGDFNHTSLRLGIIETPGFWNSLVEEGCGPSLEQVFFTY